MNEYFSGTERSPMKVRILGASGGIGEQARTTSLLVDGDVLVDAGTGVGDLTLAELRAIDHVFLTHSHLDHVAMLPFLLDTVGADRPAPVRVHAQEATLAALRRHLFNDALWPDFSRLPTPEAPFMTYHALPAGEALTLGRRRVRSVPVNHVVPAVGYLLSADAGSIAFSGDTTVTDEFWKVLNGTPDLRHVIVETSFLDADAELSRIAKHLCPSMLAGELKKLKPGPRVHITHLMPGREDDIMREIARHVPDNTPTRLTRGQVFEL
jgi:ribonuclease BN (tRNA processing enzyme)